MTGQPDSARTGDPSVRATGERTSRIAFITPSFHTLGPTWRRDLQILKLAAPQIAGALFANGYRDIRQYDFEVQIFQLELEHPGRLDLRAFFDDGAVDRFLTSDEITL